MLFVRLLGFNSYGREGAEGGDEGLFVEGLGGECWVGDLGEADSAEGACG